MAKIQTERYFEKVRTKYGDKVEILSEFQGEGKTDNDLLSFLRFQGKNLVYLTLADDG